MYYEINVAYHGKHLFATAERSITSPYTLKLILRKFIEKFPESEGYTITVSKVTTTMEELQIDL